MKVALAFVATLLLISACLEGAHSSVPSLREKTVAPGPVSSQRQSESECGAKIVECIVLTGCAFDGQDNSDCCEKLGEVLECASDACGSSVDSDILEELSGCEVADNIEPTCIAAIAQCLPQGGICPGADLTEPDAECCSEVGVVEECVGQTDCPLSEVLDGGLSSACGSVRDPDGDLTDTDEEPNEDEEETNGENSADCFPGHALVETEDGAVLRMDQIKTGQRVRVAPGPGGFSPVFFWSHSDPNALTKYYEFTTSRGTTLEASSRHLVFTESGAMEARYVTKGNKLVDGITGELLQVEDIASSTKRGLYNPHTLDGNIVVNGYLASTFTGSVPMRLAKVALLPEKIAFRLGTSVYGTALHGESFLREALVSAGTTSGK